MPSLKILRLILQLPLLFLLLTASGAAADNLTAVTQASDSARVHLQKAISNRDSEALSSLFTEDGSLITVGGYQVSGRFRIRMAAKIAMLSSDNGELITKRDSLVAVDEHGATYRETGSYTFQITANGKPTGKSYIGHYRIIWAKEDGVWKIMRAVGLK